MKPGTNGHNRHLQQFYSIDLPYITVELDNNYKRYW